MSADHDSRHRVPPSDGDPCGEGEGETRRDADLLRCACGSLLARYVAGKIELKCRRCKRTVLVPLDGAEVAAE
jgi:hypothetical protein